MDHSATNPRGDIVAFLYPEDVRQTYVKRVIGLPGDRIRMVNKQVVRNGRLLVEPYTRHIDASIDTYRDNFPAGAPEALTTPRGRDMLLHHVQDAFTGGFHAAALTAVAVMAVVAVLAFRAVPRRHSDVSAPSTASGA